jgi:hypothetical protein
MEAQVVDEKVPQDRAKVADSKESSNHGETTALGHDIGAQMFQEVQHYSEDIESERLRVRKKLDRILMPIVSI